MKFLLFVRIWQVEQLVVRHLISFAGNFGGTGTIGLVASAGVSKLAFVLALVRIVAMFVGALYEILGPGGSFCLVSWLEVIVGQCSLMMFTVGMVGSNIVVKVGLYE